MTTHKIWQLYSKDVEYFILSKVKDNSITDDLLQETFLKVHTKLHQLKDLDRVKPWVLSIARNTTSDYFKSTNKIFKNDIDFEDVEEDEPSHTEKDCLLGHILNLDKKYRTPLFLADIKGIKQTIISEQLNLPLPTVKSRIQRARLKIAEGFMECCGYSRNEKGFLVGELQEVEDCKTCST